MYTGSQMSNEAARSSTRGMRAFGKSILYFGVRGPPLGWVLFYLELTFIESAASQWSLESLLSIPSGLLVMSFVAVPFSYVFGLIPALAVGALSPFVRRQIRSGGMYLAAMTAVGCIVSITWAALALGQDVRIFTQVVAWSFYILPGAGASLICALLHERSFSKVAVQRSVAA